MLDFLQSHILLLPQTYSDLLPKQQVTYKEMTTTTHFLEDLEVTDWTTLDYAASSHPAFADLTFKGSLFQQIVNTRHLPLLFSYRSSFHTVPKAPLVPKLDYSCSSTFYEQVESELLALTDNQLIRSPNNGSCLVAYTDGSCPNNRTLGPDNPAGWGFTTYQSSSPFSDHLDVTDQWAISHGMVKTTPSDTNVIIPLDGSKNTDRAL